MFHVRYLLLVVYLSLFPPYLVFLAAQFPCSSKHWNYEGYVWTFWFVLSVNFDGKSFEIIYSLHDQDDEQIMKHGNLLVDAIKIIYRLNY